MREDRDAAARYRTAVKAASSRSKTSMGLTKLDNTRARALPNPTLSSRPIFGEVYNRADKFLSVEHLVERLNEYFDKTETRGRRPTIVGLALELGYSSKQKLFADLNADSNFSNNLEAAVSYIESLRNDELLSGGPATSGIIFDLKNNHAWAEKTEQKVETGTDTLAQLVQSLQGRVLRPRILIEEGEFTEYREEDVI